MRCKKHKDIWLYEDMIEKKGFCPLCGVWYPLKGGKKK
jgi:hypothetical protein